MTAGKVKAYLKKRGGKPSEKLVRELKGRKGVTNPWALAKWIEKKRGKR